MARVQTEQRVVNEGRTGRIIARRGLRRTLGNPKKRERDLAELLQEMYFKGITSGKKLENLRIRYSTAGMEYGSDYTVEGKDVQENVALPVCDVPVPEPAPASELSAYTNPADPRYDYPDGDAIPS